MDRIDRLGRAAEHIFAPWQKDVAAELCLENVKYGLAKIHYVQETLGLRPDATFVASPDVTVTINTYRWCHGFGYGGKLAWGDGDAELMILEAKPNCCGMIVGGMEKLPALESVIRRASEMKEKRCEIDGVKIKWNLEKGNHFVDVFRVRPIGDTKDLPPFAFMVHTSGSELKKETPLGMGLYVDSSAKLQSMAEPIDTPFGTSYCLTGKAASEYHAFYKKAEAFANSRRRLAAELLFGDFHPLSNANHQGLLSLNEIALGVNTWMGETNGALFPLALRPDLSAYLMRGLPNFTPELVEQFGWRERAERHDVLRRLTKANFLPHGAGYQFPHLERLLKVHELNGRRYFEVKSRGAAGSEILYDLRNIPYEYRGREIFEQTVDLKLGEPVAELVPVYVLKI